jgi:NAD dependent epimerase/dehydratase
MNILITGAEGFIGSHLSETLVKLGHKVKCIVLYNSFNDYGWLDHIDKNVLAEIEICFGDIRDQSFVKESMKKCDVVIHLAALIGIPYSYISPKSYVETNVMGTLNILQSAKELKVSKLIHTSTSEVYGSAQFIPITEKHPLNGQSPYSATKIAADQLANSFYLSFNTPVVTLRPFNTYGPRQSLRAIIPTIICQNLSRLKKIKLGTINTTRDFTYISDTVSAFISAIKSKDAIGKTINIGTGFEISIKRISEVIMKITNKKVKIVSEKARTRPDKSEVSRLCCSNKMAKKILKWEPKYTGLHGLEKGITQTVNWFNKFENLKKYKVKDFTF